MKIQIPQLALAGPISMAVLTACTLFPPSVSLLRAEPTDPIPPTKPLSARALSEEKDLAEKEQERDVVRAVLEIQKQLGGPLVQKSDLLKPITDDRLPPSPEPTPQGYGPARHTPGHHAPRQYAPGQHAPGQHAPGRYAPGQHAPRHNAPGPRAPWLHPPGQPHPPIPQRLAPKQAVPKYPNAPGGPRFLHSRPEAGKSVELLRKTASELDRAANRLEWANLYPQADALRELAHGLRLEARKRQESRR